MELYSAGEDMSPSTSARLEGKVALISGGARGQGAAHGALFAEHGAKVVLGDILDSLGEQEAGRLRARGLDVLFTHLDVTSKEDWDSAVALTEREFGSLNTLVNNAGVAAFAGAADATDDEWTYVIGINQKGVFYGMRSAIPAMRRGGGGSIINISSCAGLVGMPGYFAYQASKGAVIMMTKSVALEYAGDNIRANTICPGLIYTPMTEYEPEEAVQANLDETPMRRGGKSVEVSYGALYLASDESSFVTGTELVIDGGYVAH
jgi:NAD(P)-dependent dehydrogenase (short-subunit alcohol dehydrogenase family)